MCRIEYKAAKLTVHRRMTFRPILTLFTLVRDFVIVVVIVCNVASERQINLYFDCFIIESINVVSSCASKLIYSCSYFIYSKQKQKIETRSQKRKRESNIPADKERSKRGEVCSVITCLNFGKIYFSLYNCCRLFYQLRKRL